MNDAEMPARLTPGEEIQELERAGLRRRLRTLRPGAGMTVQGVQGAQVVNFSSNDYLGLAGSEVLKAALVEGVGLYGAGAGASRLVCGTLPAHEALEEVLAAFKGTEAALTFSSGYATAVGVIPALCGRDDVVILDKLSHASLIDAARLSGATIRVFPHNHLEKLGRLLAGARQGNPSRRVLVVTESIFSMDGDAAPLAEMVALKERHEAWLLVDEAHAVGVLGPQGRGLAAALGLDGRIELQMGTLSKALGVSGGYLACSREMADLCINRARSLIYSTAPPPALAHAAAAAVRLVQGAAGEALRARLFANRRHLEPLLGAGLLARLPAAILPLVVGGEQAAVEASAALLEKGWLIPAIRYPTVARGSARLRLTVSAAHEEFQVKGLVAGLLHLMPQLGCA